jgi:NagD protein
MDQVLVDAASSGTGHPRVAQYQLKLTRHPPGDGVGDDLLQQRGGQDAFRAACISDLEPHLDACCGGIGLDQHQVSTVGLQHRRQFGDGRVNGFEVHTPKLCALLTQSNESADEVMAKASHLRYNVRMRPTAETWLIDMDGVLVHEGVALKGAADFLAQVTESGHRFLVLTNNSIFTPRDLAARLVRAGLPVPESSIWTSALATATFLADQLPGGSAYVVGEAGLTTALHEVGYTLTDVDPDYVVLGETRTYSFESITKAIRLIDAGGRFIATNPDATGREPYFIGKPNPMMFRSAMNRMDAHSETTVMVGDRMDTDVVAGIEAGLDTILVLSGVTKLEDIERFPFRPGRILEGIFDAIELI